VTTDTIILDSSRLAAASTNVLACLTQALNTHGFGSSYYGQISGKQVTRYVNISALEEYLLRRQVLNGDEDLALLYDLLLFDKYCAVDAIVTMLDDQVVAHLEALDILRRHGDAVHLSACLAPLRGKFFLNDGMRFQEHPHHVLTLVLEQAYIAEVVSELYSAQRDGTQGRVLDICAGSGVIGQACAPRGWTVDGIDINPRAVDYARFNSFLNGQMGNDYWLLDICDKAPEQTYDLIVTNPPYNARVPVDDESPMDITLHGGKFGDDLSRAIFDRLQSMLNPGGAFFLVGIVLLKDGELWHPVARELSAKGTLVFLHQPISKVTSWEGLRLLYNCTPDFERIPPGELMRMLLRETEFNEVAWGIVAYFDNGRPGYHSIYNLPTDAVLVSDSAMAELKSIVGDL
jgi:hypothetical protein